MDQEISYVQFGILSSNDIKKLSVCEITSTKLSGVGSVYDPRMGTLDEVPCVTCGQNSKFCPGHFGHLSLSCRIMNPLYNRLIVSILKCICFKCSRLLYSEQKLRLNNLYKTNNISRFQVIIKELEKVFICCHCGSHQAKYVYNNAEKSVQMSFKVSDGGGSTQKLSLSDDEIYKIFANMKVTDIKLLGMKPGVSHPKDLIMSDLLVLPTVARPFVLSDDGLTSDDDLSLQYIECLKANIQIRKNESEVKRTKFQNILKFRIRGLFDNTNQQQKVSNGRSLKGIKRRISGKEGLIRSNLSGKRVEKSARSVIGPDTSLRVDEIAVPHEIANSLSYPIKVNQYNIEEVQKLIDDNKANFILRNKSDNSKEQSRINLNYATSTVKSDIQNGDLIYRSGVFYTMIRSDSDKFNLQSNDIIVRNGQKLNLSNHITRRKFQVKIGDICERKLKDGDYLLLNRQPSLHRGSLIAQKIKVMPCKTIRMNLAITSSLNADFDGDESNLILPSNSEATYELQSLSSVDNFIQSPQNSSANIKVVQDCIVSSYLMTLSKHQTPMSKESFMKSISSLDNFDYQWYLRKKKQFCELVNQPDMYMYTGRFLFSLLLPEEFDYRKNNEVDSIENELIIQKGILIQGAVCKKDLNKIISLLYLEFHQDIQIVKQFINNVQFLGNEYLLFHGFSIGLKDCLINNKKETVESTIQKAIMKAKNINMNVRNPYIKEVYTRYSLIAARDMGLSISKKCMDEDNNFKIAVESGSKGQLFNLCQISSCLGQMEVLGKRPEPQLYGNRTLPHYPLKESEMTDRMSFEARGFIFNSFLHGLTPQEYYFHSLTGREGISDTSLKTSCSGYIQRRLVKSTEDLYIQQDSTIRNRDNSIVQFSYANHLNPTHCILKKNNQLSSFDMSRLVTQINNTHEQQQQNQHQQQLEVV